LGALLTLGAERPNGLASAAAASGAVAVVAPGAPPAASASGRSSRCGGLSRSRAGRRVRGGGIGGCRVLVCRLCAGGGRCRGQSHGRLHALLRGREQVMAGHVAVLRFTIDDGPVAGVLAGVEAVPAGDGVPVGVDRAGGTAHRAGAAPGVVVLETTADVVRMTHVRRDLIVEAERHVVVVVPREAAIAGDVETAIMADRDDARVDGVDPDRVVIRVRAGQALPGLATVQRHLARRAADKELVHVLGVDPDLRKVRRALVLIADEDPGLAGVVGAVDAVAVFVRRRRDWLAVLVELRLVACGRGRRFAVIAYWHGSAFDGGAAAGAGAVAGFYLGVDDPGVRREDGQRDAAVETVSWLGPAGAVELYPGFAGVDGLPKASVGAAAVVAPAITAALKRSRVDDLRVRGVEDDVVEARVLVDVLEVLPGLAAVDGLEQAALGIGSEEMTG
jgi:hypothetical protein